MGNKNKGRERTNNTRKFGGKEFVRLDYNVSESTVKSYKDTAKRLGYKIRVIMEKYKGDSSKKRCVYIRKGK